MHGLNQGLVSPIPPSLTGECQKVTLRLAKNFSPIQSEDEMLVDGCFQGTEQILNIRYSP